MKKVQKKNRPGLAPEAVRFKGLRRKNNNKIIISHLAKSASPILPGGGAF